MLHELRSREASLEEAFLHLTGGEGDDRPPSSRRRRRSHRTPWAASSASRSRRCTTRLWIGLGAVGLAALGAIATLAIAGTPDGLEAGLTPIETVEDVRDFVATGRSPGCSPWCSGRPR